MIVAGKEIERFFFHQPVFHDLTGEFHEIPEYGSAGKTVIIAIGEQGMQGMAKLVENGSGFIQAQQRGLSIGGWSKATHDHHMRSAHTVGIHALVKERALPGSATFGFAGEKIDVKQAKIAVIGIVRFPGGYIRMIYGNVVHLFHGDTVDLFSHCEEAVDHVFHLEPGAQLLRIVLEELFLEFIAVISPIPGFQGLNAIQFLGKGSHCFHFFLRRRKGLFIHGFQEVQGIIHGFCHTVFQNVLGVAFVAQKLRSFLSEGQSALDDILSGVFIIESAGRRGAVHLVAQLAVLTIGDKGTEAGGLQSEDPAAFLALLFGCEGCCFQGSGRNSLYVLRIGEMELKSIGGVQYVVTELG
ncbi:hypothetical protein DSECCO2_481350 [anaerobic digester metagenome]